MRVIAAQPVKCRFCDQPSRYACDSPAHVRREIDARDILHGDWVFSPQSNRLCQVVDIQANSPAGHVLLITVEYRHGRKRPPYPQCATAVCEAHVRELAEHKHLCRDHWRAWETIACGNFGSHAAHTGGAL